MHRLLEPHPGGIEPPLPSLPARADLRENEFERREVKRLVAARGAEAHAKGEIKAESVKSHKAGDRPSAHEEEGQREQRLAKTEYQDERVKSVRRH